MVVFRFQRLLAVFFAVSFVFIIFYHHLERIISQTMYIYGLVRKEHGNEMERVGTYGIDTTLYEPNATKYYNKKPISLLILVSSKPSNFKLRHAIRSSWGKCDELDSYLRNNTNYWNGVSCNLIFYMGRSLDEQTNLLNMKELETHKDVIIGDFIDSYKNMTRKILYAFNWASERYFCEYILKTDDDIYMNVPKLIHALKTKYSDVVDLYGGYTYYASVVRDKGHRHYLSLHEYPDDWYPPYNKGSQLIISGHLISKVIVASTQIRRFQIDDAYLGILMNRIVVLPTKVSEFVQNQYVCYLIDWISSCDLESMVGIGDSLNPHQILYIHRTVHAFIPWYCIRYDKLLFYGCLLLCFVLVFWCMKKQLLMFPLRVVYNAIKIKK